jgi:hypothetical protein
VFWLFRCLFLYKITAKFESALVIISSPSHQVTRAEAKPPLMICVPHLKILRRSGAPRAVAVAKAHIIHTRKSNYTGNAGMSTARKLGAGPTHKRTEGRAPLWDSEFTAQAAALQGEESEEFVLSPFVVACGQVFLSRTVHQNFRAEELAERRLRVTAPITPGSRSESTARGT